MKFREFEDSEWINGFKRLAEDKEMPDDLIEVALTGKATNWPKEIVLGAIDTIRSIRPELAQRIATKVTV